MDLPSNTTPKTVVQLRIEAKITIPIRQNEVLISYSV